MNAYLHIPFCASICSYCYFTSFAGQDSKVASYVKALCLEIEKSSLEGPLQTVYFGGGTPSVLSPAELQSILRALRDKATFDAGAEISLEANPETATLEKFKAYRNLGVNRLSFGAQASQASLLRKMGRGHLWDQVEKAFDLARGAGFDNLNLDLMFGLPSQTLFQFQESVGKALDLRPDHLSLYALQVEEGTPLARQVKEGLPLPSDDTVADEYAWAQTAVLLRGLSQYEVSNFAGPGKECRHNWNIWRGQDYWGFGLSAVGTVQGVRHSHGEDLASYIEALLKGKTPPLSLENLSIQTREFEKIMLGLRTRQGVKREELDRYARSNRVFYQERFNQFEKEGLLSGDSQNIRVTARGYFVLNGLLESLVA